MPTIKSLSKALLVSLLSLVGNHVSAQTITVSPDRILMDETTAVRVTGLKPSEHITIRSELVDGENKIWSAEAEFVAGDQGDVDVTRQAPVKGSYRNVSAMGLIWSMRSTTKDTNIYRAPRGLKPQIIKFSLSSGDKEISTATLEQLAIADNVKQIQIDGKLHGIFFVPDGVTKHAAVLVLGGSEGGIPVPKAAWLASHGYPALALAYFRFEGLPSLLEDIPLEYFGNALGWLSQRPEADKEHIAVVGTSRGGELALQLGSLYPIIRAVVAYVPANMRYPGCCGGVGGPAWTLKGVPLAYAQPGRGHTLPANELMAVIHAEQTRGPILLISGQDDTIWPSSDMTNEVARRLHQNHFSFEVERLDYPHAGHRAGQPQIVPTWSSNIIHPVSGNFETFGGTPEGNAASSLDAAPKVLEFLRGSLQSPQP